MHRILLGLGGRTEVPSPTRAAAIRFPLDRLWLHQRQRASILLITMRRYLRLVTALAALQIGKSASGQAPTRPAASSVVREPRHVSTCERRDNRELSIELPHRQAPKRSAHERCPHPEHGCWVALKRLDRNGGRTDGLIPPGSSPSSSMRSPTGVSSPSNTPPEGRCFSRLTIADIVDAQHRRVAEVLKLPRLHAAILASSMGGMQGAFEWAW